MSVNWGGEPPPDHRLTVWEWIGVSIAVALWVIALYQIGRV